MPICPTRDLTTQDKESATSRPLSLSRLFALAAGVALLLVGAVAPASRVHATVPAARHRVSARVASVVPCPPTYVAIGASDAAGVGANDPANESWPAVIARQLPRGTHFVDLGVPSITLARANSVELPVALDALTPAPSGTCAARPGLVTVWLAVNDLVARTPLDAYAAELQTLLSTLRARTHATVLVGNLPDLALVPAFRGQDPAGLNAVVAAWNGVIAATAQRNGARLVDLHSRWRDLAAHPEYVGADGLHPTMAGYRVLAGLFWRALR